MNTNPDGPEESRCIIFSLSGISQKVKRLCIRHSCIRLRIATVFSEGIYPCGNASYWDFESMGRAIDAVFLTAWLQAIERQELEFGCFSSRCLWSNRDHLSTMRMGVIPSQITDCEKPFLLKFLFLAIGVVSTSFSLLLFIVLTSNSLLIPLSLFYLFK